MAATTISTYSDALETQIGSSSAAPGAPAPGNLSRSKVICAPFIWTCNAEVSGTSIGFVKIPKGARLLTGYITASATLTNNATVAIGLAAVDGTGVIAPAVTVAVYGVDGVATTSAQSDSTTCLKAAGSALSTSKVEFLATSALGFGYELQKECWLTGTTGAGTVGTTEIVRGYVLYAVD